MFLLIFTKEAVPVGSVVMVPIRTREVPAIVLEVKEVSDMKSILKSSDYAVRKIARIKPQHIWSSAYIKAVIATARFSAQGLGETLLAVTPKAILDAYLEKTLMDVPALEKANVEISHHSPVLATQSDTKIRMESYQRLVRESFVRGESIFICVPTILDVENIAQILGHGIEDYTYSFHSGVTKKRLLNDWKDIQNAQHAILVIATPQYLMLPHTFTTIVLDEEHSHAWKTLKRPFIDMRVFAEYYAKELGSTLILGAPILRPETHKRIEGGEVNEYGTIAHHALSEIESFIIDPRIEEKDLKERTGRRSLSIISEQVRCEIERAQENRKSTLLIAVRKGLAPITSCGDCGTLIKCPACDTPLVIHKHGDEGRIYSCHSCGFMRRPEGADHETCPTCGGWRLEPLGLGIERIEEEVAMLFPDAQRFIFDGDHIKTLTQARKCITEFEKTPGAILIATPMAVPYISTVSHTSIISIDSLFAIPDIRMNERIFALILSLREKTLINLMVQTRTDDTTILKSALKGDLVSFIEEELALRKAFSYPPYGTIIKVTLRSSSKSARTDMPAEMERFKNFLTEYELIIPKTIAREGKGVFRMYAILKLVEGEWVDNALLTKLRALPPQFSIEVNPDHLL